MKEPITVSVHIEAPHTRVWEYFNEPAHITQWCTGSPDWHTPRAENDLREGGRFLTRMEAKDGSAGFDFAGVYTNVTPQHEIAYVMDDGRAVRVTFTPSDGGVLVTETFDPEDENTPELQREGWQGILDRFKTYVETHE